MKPPVKSIAVDSVCGSPIASMTYGGFSTVPSTRTPPPGVSVREVCATTRTLSLSSITSAPASRSSSRPFSSWFVPSVARLPLTVIRTPGPTAGTVPARMPRVCACCRARSRAVRRLSVSLRSESRVSWSLAIWVSVRCEASDRLLMYWIRSPCRAPRYRSSRPFACTWVTAAKPSTASSRATVICARDPGRRSAVSSRVRPSGVGSPGVGSGVRSGVVSGMEDVPPDRGHVGEDPDAEHHDHPGGELSADAELVTEVDDQRRDQHVRDERHHEDLVVEDPVEEGAQRTEDGVQGGHHRDREVRLEPHRDVRLEEQSEEDAGEQAEGGDHGRRSGWCA